MMAKANSLLGRAILLSLGFFVPAGSLLAQPPNLLQNPGFDVDLSHWTTEGSVVWSPVDADDDPDSGSALVDGGGGGSYIHQCVAVEANAGYLAKVLILYDPKPVKDDEARMRIFWYGENLCMDGSIVGLDHRTLIPRDTVWYELSASNLIAPADAASARVDIVVLPSSGAEQAHVDEFRLIPTEIFSDGFESGDLSAWAALRSD